MSRRKRPAVPAVAPQPAHGTAGDHTPAASAGRRPLSEIVPSWVSALTGVIALILVIVGYNAVSESQARQPDASVRAVEYGRIGLTALGDYAAIRPDRDEVVLLGRPATDTDGLWAHAEAQLSPTVLDARTGTEDGEFEATMPVDTLGENWLVRVVVVAGGLSGLEPWTELAELGADCSCVLYAGDEIIVSTSPSP